MHLQHVAARQLSTLTRRYPALRHFSLTVCLLVLAWVYTIYKGERTASDSSVQACQWSSWEHWPAGATPHHLVFIADPQIVDPHTYPGRPWPLSTLTERYTDRYMRRNFRLINEKLDPDSVVFLGDLFDGGREWATSKARPLKASQKKKLEAMGVKDSEVEKQDEVAGSADTKRDEMGADSDEEDHLVKRSMESYKAALMRPHSRPITKEEHNIDKRGNDLKEFVPGENGRWKKWGPAQWDLEFDRLGKIFFEPGQLYPNPGRKAFAAWDVPSHPITVENGASEFEWQEYAIAGGKTRRLLTSLPGNHDVGFGPGVQLAVRDRFNTHFGEGNGVNVLGNHTFVSIDAPSLAAFSQFDVGGETPREVADGRKHLWKPAMDFLDDLQSSSARAVTDTIQDYYPTLRLEPSYTQTVASTQGNNNPSPHSKSNPPRLPIILLSHVPLYRDPNTDCGRLRERGSAISIAGGYQYQNTLTRGLSATIAQKVSAAGDIVHIFSGDDHDYCDVSHRYNVGSIGENRGPRLANIREITVKSFSWAMGVRKPGFLLLSLWNPVNSRGETIGTPLPTMQTHLCLLPDQLGIFISYAQFAGLTLLLLLFRAIILSLRAPIPTDADEEQDTLSKLTLPRFRPHQAKPNGTANGYSTPNKKETKSRQRAASTGLKPTPDTHQNQNLGVQRSFNARTRSVSPAAGYSPSPSGPLIEKAGFYPQVRWDDPSDVSDDEESRVGDADFAEDTDSQAKWKRRQRVPGKARRAWLEFKGSLSVVAMLAGGYYIIMVRNG